MENQEFVLRMKEKIERLTERAIELRIDPGDETHLEVDFNREVPLVVFGSNAVRYSGFARMCIEYAVASLRERREINLMEFHLLLARN